MTCSVELINLLSGSQNSETFYLLGYEFIIKGCDSDMARWKTGGG